MAGAHQVLQIRAMMASDAWESRGQAAVLLTLGAAACQQPFCDASMNDGRRRAMGTRSHMMDGRQLMRQMGSVVSWAAARLALAAIALTVMAGCARVSTAHVEMSTDRLPRPELILVHDYQVSRDEVQLDSAISSRVERTVQGTPEAEDQLKVAQEVSRVLTTTLVDEIRKLGIRAEPAAMASPVAGPTLSIEGQIG